MRKILYIISAIIAATTVFAACSGKSSGSLSGEASDATSLAEVLAAYEAGPWDSIPTMPDSGCVRLQTRRVGDYKRTFNDSNHVQMATAAAIGITPVSNPCDAWFVDKPLVRVKTCEDFYLDTLTHSYPYLLPEANELLHVIGREFNKRLAERGGGNYRILATSLLRTFHTVKRLKRGNKNAVDTSTHMMATTFDISHRRFHYGGEGTRRTSDDLKALLAEVLYDLREQGRCHVIYEVKQSCFHITVRPSATKE